MYSDRFLTIVTTYSCLPSINDPLIVVPGEKVDEEVQQLLSSHNSHLNSEAAKHC